MSSYVTFFWSAGAVVPCGTAKNTTLCGFGRDFVIPSHVIPSWPVWVRGTDCFVVLNSSQPHLSDGPSESLSSQVDLLSHAVKLNHAHYYWFLEAASWVALGCVSQLCWFYVVGYICDKRKFCSNPKSQSRPSPVCDCPHVLNSDLAVGIITFLKHLFYVKRDHWVVPRPSNFKWRWIISFFLWVSEEWLILDMIQVILMLLHLPTFLPIVLQHLLWDWNYRSTLFIILSDCVLLPTFVTSVMTSLRNPPVDQGYYQGEFINRKPQNKVLLGNRYHWGAIHLSFPSRA